MTQARFVEFVALMAMMMSLVSLSIDAMPVPRHYYSNRESKPREARSKDENGVDARERCRDCTASGFRNW